MVFAPHLAKIVGLKRRYVSFFKPTAHPYDVLLDDYEPGLTTKESKRCSRGSGPVNELSSDVLANAPPSATGCSMWATRRRASGISAWKSRRRSDSTGRGGARTSQRIRTPRTRDRMTSGLRHGSKRVSP